MRPVLGPQAPSTSFSYLYRWHLVLMIYVFENALQKKNGASSTLLQKHWRWRINPIRLQNVNRSVRKMWGPGFPRVNLAAAAYAIRVIAVAHWLNSGTNFTQHRMNDAIIHDKRLRSNTSAIRSKMFGENIRGCYPNRNGGNTEFMAFPEFRYVPAQYAVQRTFPVQNFGMFQRSTQFRGHSQFGIGRSY